MGQKRPIDVICGKPYDPDLQNLVEQDTRKSLDGQEKSQRLLPQWPT
jgi:hypothetical protein